MIYIGFVVYLVKSSNCLLRVAQNIDFSLYRESRLKSEFVCFIIQACLLKSSFGLRL